MKNFRHSGWWMVAVMTVALLAAPAMAQNAPKREIVVSLPDHELALLEDGRVVRVYPVAVGKPSTPSPVGTFTIVHRVVNPTYYHHGEVIPPGPANPVGNRWMSLSVKGYGIHGTNRPRSIGKAASHGCIRMARRDLEDLFQQVRVGDTVVLVGERDEQTAQIFGDGPVPAVAVQQPVQVVKEEPAPSPASSEPSATPSADIAGLMAKNTPVPAAGLSVAGSW